jgi:hypothetical protein
LLAVSKGVPGVESLEGIHAEALAVDREKTQEDIPVTKSSMALLTTSGFSARTK